MRAVAFGAWVAGVAACAAVSAVAFAQESTWGTGTPRPSTDAGTPSDAEASPDASPPDAAPDSPPAEAAALPPPATEEEGGVDGGESGLSQVGLAIGVRGGYGIPFGTAKGSPLSFVVGGVVPVGLEAGWFLNPHLYLGGYFFYGFGVGAGTTNDTCSDPNTTCHATMYRAGALAHWHFTPDAGFDPWVGGGLGFDLVNIDATDSSASTVGAGSLKSFDLSLEGGIDWKPFRYVGLGPYVELAGGHYGSSTSSTSLHEWLTFGARMRTNL